MAVTTGSYQKLCSVDPQISKDFPVATKHKNLRGGRRFLVASFQDDDPIDDDIDAQGYNSMNDTSPATTFFRCVCNEPDFRDNRMTHSYCPLHFECAIPFDASKPAQCIDTNPLVSTARMAWPVMLMSTLCLVLVMFASFHGLAIVKYGRKLWHLRCCRCCSKVNREEIDQLEQEEVDELLQFHRSSSLRQEVPSRWRIQKYQLYHYQTTILSGAIVGWRRERNNLGGTPIELCLATKAYQEDTPISTGESEGVSTLIPPDAEVAEDEAEGDEANANIDDDDDKMCSICFAEFQAGERLGDLPCSHDFHADCLKTWIIQGRRNTCPLCLAPNMARRYKTK